MCNIQEIPRCVQLKFFKLIRIFQIELNLEQKRQKSLAWSGLTKIRLSFEKNVQYKANQPKLW
jgi:hypothetical protein